MLRARPIGAVVLCLAAVGAICANLVDERPRERENPPPSPGLSTGSVPAPALSGIPAPKEAARPLGVVPADVWKQLPPPPPEFRGSALEWELQAGASVERLRSLLTLVPVMSHREREEGLLAYIRRNPRPELAGDLLAIKSVVPATTESSGFYAAALSATALAMRKHPGPADAGAPSARDLCLTAVQLLRQRAEDWGIDCPADMWAGLRHNCETRWQLAVPRLLEDERFAPEFEALRKLARLQFQALISPEGAFAGGTHVFGFSSVIWSRETGDDYLRVLNGWTVAEPKLGTGSTGTSRAVLSNIAAKLRDRGDEGQLVQLADWLLRRKSEVQDRSFNERQQIHLLLASLSKNESLPDEWRTRTERAVWGERKRYR